ncbi:MAG: Gx transporter family protein [Clostridiaceae bacterium]|jgi:uncharacterized membrane protein|nr:Gx transporter family protein [Clostridiaceae bacterium]
MKAEVSKIAKTGIFLALALIVALLESLIPPLVPVLPYAKLGLTNIVLFACFITVGVWYGYAALVLKCLFAAIFAGNAGMILYSLPSALAAYTVAVLLFNTGKLSLTGASALSGIIFNAVQVGIAAALAGAAVFVYLPYMTLAGAIAGFVTGMICRFIIKHVPLKLIFGNNELKNADIEAGKTEVDEVKNVAKEVETEDGEIKNGELKEVEPKE